MKKRLGYSERLVRNIVLLSFIIVLLATFYAFKYQSDDVWDYVIQFLKLLTPSTVGFFIWKARGENVIKIRNNPDFDQQEYAQSLQRQYETKLAESFKEELNDEATGDNRRY